MKKAKPLFIPGLIVLLLTFNRCTPNRDFLSPTNEMLTHSNWGVEYFYDIQDMTSEYGGYRLLFSNTGAVATQYQNEIVQGSWNISVDSDNNEVLSINFNSADNNISKFNQQWKLTRKTITTLQFEGTSHPVTTSQLRIRRQ